MGLLLYILSRLLGLIFIPVALIYSMIQSIYRKKFFAEGIPDINAKFMSMAVAFDMYGNVVGKEIFNDTLIKDKTIHPFGKKGETISQAIGWNKYYNNLTKTGKILDNILDFFDPNHSLKSIGK
jgi:hypothetical protein